MALPDTFHFTDVVIGPEVASFAPSQQRQNNSASKPSVLRSCFQIAYQKITGDGRWSIESNATRVEVQAGPTVP